jgi:hypothetical protein
MKQSNWSMHFRGKQSRPQNRWGLKACSSFRGAGFFYYPALLHKAMWLRIQSEMAYVQSMDEEKLTKVEFFYEPPKGCMYVPDLLELKGETTKDVKQIVKSHELAVDAWYRWFVKR